MKPPSKTPRARRGTPVSIQLDQATRALRTISACNQVLVRATDEPAMLHDVCRAIVTEGGYRLVWVGYVEYDARKSVRPVASFGYEHGYLETVDISWADVPKGRGPTGTAIRQKRPVACRDMLQDPNYLPWRDEARRRGYASSIVLPLLSDGDAIGALNIYATEPDAFDDNETKLLAELADDLAFGIQALRTRRARDEAEAEARRNAALLRQTEAISHVGGWEYDVPGHHLIWSDETYRIHDLAPGGDECSVERALGFYSHESRLRLTEALARATGQGESYDLEPPLVTAKGRRIWVRTVGRAESRDGKVVRVFGNIVDITERKRTGEALRRSEASLKEAQRLAHIGNWELDLVHNVLTWSDEIYRIFELDPAGFGASYEAFLDAIHPDDRAAVNQAYTHSLESRTPYAIVHRLRMKDGCIKHVQERCETTYDDDGRPLRSFGTIQDVTERQLAEEHIRELNVGLEKRVADRTQELTAERATLEAIFDSVNVGMLLLDRDGTVKRLNRVATRWTSRSAPVPDRTQCGDVLGCIHAHETLAGCGGSPSCRSCPLRTAFTSVLHSGDSMHGIEWEAVILVETCETCFWFEVNVDPVPLAGDRHAVVSLHDITDRKRASLAIEGLNHQLAMRARELETANQELETFAYSVSHDLRAPLRAIDGFSRILLRDSAAALGDAGRENLRHVREASQHMGQLIDDMLQLSRTSRAAIHRSPINLSQLAEAILADLRLAHPERAAVCTVTPGLLVNADPTLMRAALENLLGNAWKFTGRVAEARIEFGADTSKVEPVFFVRDNGAGFDMAYADRLFGPFQRLHTVSEFPGTGIGLATVQRIIHRHGGRLWAEAKVGAGATFFFTLPASPEPS